MTCTNTPGLHNNGCTCPPETPIPDRTRHEWRVEALEEGHGWVWVAGGASTSRYWALKRRDGFLQRFPNAKTRIIRVTTTHTIEGT